MRSFPFAAVAAGSLIAAGAQAATESRIGTAASTTNEVSGQLGGARRLLKLGDGVFQNESIATGTGASAQILFADETALTLGPNSRVTLDKAVYDPATRKGELVLRATSGAFRFVSGSGPKEGYRIGTPMGTIGVRGTIIEFAIRGQWLMLSLTEGGTYLCTTAQNCVELSKPGTYLVTNGTQIGSEKSKFDKSCDESHGLTKCLVGSGDNALYLNFLGLGRVFNELAPGAGPNLPPGNNPPPGNGPPPPGPPPPGPPPPQTGFAPIMTGAGTIPPGLENRSTLPPGLANRGPSFLPPGQQKK
ncbi:MAG: FecR family protein [Alphaproteobacteria bacterium]